MEHQKYSQLPFGIENIDSLIQASTVYLQQVIRDSNSISDEMIAHLSDEIKAKFSHGRELATQEIADIERELENPEELFSFLTQLYQFIVASELEGKSEDDIYQLVPNMERIRKLAGLIQFDLASGSDQTSVDWWGYPFIQGFLATNHN